MSFNSPGWLAGQCVMIVGLQNKPELNGQLAAARSYNQTSGRYEIQIAHNGSLLMVKADNLQLNGPFVFGGFSLPTPPQPTPGVVGASAQAQYAAPPPPQAAPPPSQFVASPPAQHSGWSTASGAASSVNPFNPSFGGGGGGGGGFVFGSAAAPPAFGGFSLPTPPQPTPGVVGASAQAQYAAPPPPQAAPPPSQFVAAWRAQQAARKRPAAAGSSAGPSRQPSAVQYQAAGSSSAAAEPSPQALTKRQKSKAELASDDGLSLWPVQKTEEPAVWRALSKLTATNPAWLGKGRDASKLHKYSVLELASAWRIDNPRRSKKVDGGTQALEDELEVLRKKGALEMRDVAANVMTAAAAAELSAAHAAELSAAHAASAGGGGASAGGGAAAGGSSAHAAATGGGALVLRSELNEVLLFHGAEPSKLLAILANGLNERFSGTNAGTAFGNGAYCAEDLGKADQYAQVDVGYDPKSELHQRLYGRSYRHPDSVYYAVVCRVALGMPIRTTQAVTQVGMAGVTSCDAPRVRVFPVNERELAVVPGVQPPVHYHSLIAEKGPGHDRYREYVIFHASDHVCPEYLIAYHRV